MAQILEQDFESWSPESRGAAAAVIEANGPAFEQLEKCTGLENSDFDFAYEDGFAAVTPPMLALHRAGRMVAMDLRLALVEEDRERISRDLEILDQLSRALARESFLISALIHLGLERLFLGAIRDVVEESSSICGSSSPSRRPRFWIGTVSWSSRWGHHGSKPWNKVDPRRASSDGRLTSFC